MRLICLSACLLWGSWGCSLELERARRFLESADSTEREEGLKLLAREKSPDTDKLILPLLRDPSARVRKHAVVALGAVGGAKHLRQLSDRLEDSDLEVRLTTVRVLGDSGLKGAREPLLRSLSDPSMVIRRAAAWSLKALGMERAAQQREVASLELKEQIRRLKSADDQLRASAAREVGMSGRQPGLKPLQPLLSDRSPLVVKQAAWAIGRIGGSEAGRVLAQLVRSNDPLDRQAAVLGLAELGGARTMEVLRGLVADGDAKVRQSALAALGRCEEKIEGEDLVCPLLLDPALPVAIQAAHLVHMRRWTCESQIDEICKRAQAGDASILPVLSPMHDERVSKALLALAQHTYQEYRHHAVKWITAEQWKQLDDPDQGSAPPPLKKKALAKLLDRFPARSSKDLTDPLLPPPIAVDTLERLIRALATRELARPWLAAVAMEAPLIVRTAALEALAAFTSGDDAVAGAIRTGLGSSLASVRRAAIAGCHLLGAAASEEALRLLSDVDFDVRAGAAHCLGQLRETKAVRSLLAMLKRQQSVELIKAVARIGDHRATKPLLDMLREDHPASRQGEREVIVEALGQLRDSEAVPILERELFHPRWEVRKVAAEALSKVWRASTPKALRVCQQDYFLEVRDACSMTLKTIQQPRSAGQKSGNN